MQLLLAVLWYWILNLLCSLMNLRFSMHFCFCLPFQQHYLLPSVLPFVLVESFAGAAVLPALASLSFLFPDLVESSNSLSASTILSLICCGKRLSGFASSKASDSSFNGTPSSGIFAICTPGA